MNVPVVAAQGSCSKRPHSLRVLMLGLAMAAGIAVIGQVQVTVVGTPPFCNQVNLTLQTTGLSCSSGAPAQWTLHNLHSNTTYNPSSLPGSPCQLGWTFGPGCWNVTVSINGGPDYEFPQLFCVEQPQAAFTISDTNICEGGCVEIADASTSPASPIDTWVWSGLPCPEAALGNSSFTCCLGVGNSPQLTVFANGCPATETNGGTIVVSNNYPTPIITPGSVLDCPGPVQVNLSTSGPYVSTIWSVTDTNGVDEACFGSSNTLDCDSLAEGEYQATLTVTNADGCSGSTSIPVTIFDQPDLSISVSPSPTCASVCVTLTASVSPAPAQSITWAVVDQSGQAMPSPPSGSSVSCYTFPAAGTYTVTATSTYSTTCSTSEQVDVVVYDPLVADFAPGSDTTFCGPRCIDFTNLSAGVGVLGYLWRVNGNTASTDTNPTLCFTTTSTVTLEVTNELGCTTSKTITVTIDLPELTLTNISNDCAGAPICPEYNLNVIPGEAVTLWEWDFGDGFTSEDEAPCHAYQDEGTYTICLTITTENVCTTTACRNITIYPALDASFGLTPQVVCAGDGVYFEVDNDEGSDYQWAFAGDSCSFTVNTGADPFVNILPNCQGCFDVTLTINNSGCEASQTIAEAVCFYGPVVIFNTAQTCAAPFEVDFQNTFITYDAATLEWDFNDDGIIDLMGLADDPAILDPTWDYSSDGEGTYNVCVTAYPNSYPDTCSYTRCRTIYIDQPGSNLTFGPTEGCPPLCVTFESNNEPYVVQWNVDFGNGDTLYASAVPISWWPAPISYLTHWNGSVGPPNTPINSLNSSFPGDPFISCINYNDADVYTITAIATNINGCSDTTVYENAITISTAPDFATFTTVITNACGPFCVQVIADNALDNYQWHYRTGGPWTPFGNGSSSEVLCLPNVPVYLQIRLGGDQGSCSDEQLLIVDFPSTAQATFTISDATPCQDQDVTFAATGAGANGHTWTITGPAGNTVAMGTGTPFTPSTSPFTEAGIYTVCLIVTDVVFGCADTIRQTVEVSVPSPIVDVTVTPSGCFFQVTACPDQVMPGSAYTYTLVRTYPLPVVVDPPLPTNPVTSCATSGFLSAGVYDLVINVAGPDGWSDCVASDTIEDILGLGSVLGPWTWNPLDSVNCAPYCVELTVYDTLQTGYTYIWNPDDGSPTITGTVVQHCYTQPGTYCPSLQVVFPNGCGPFFPCIDPVVVEPYEVSATTTAPICTGDCAPVLFTADNPDFGIDNIAFQPNSGVTPLVPQPPWEYDLCPTISTDYIVTANYYQCQAVVDVPVTVNPLPTLTFEPYGPFCINEGALPLPVVAALPIGGSESWSLPTGFPDPELLGPGCQHQIVYTYTDGNGCSNSIDIPFCIDDITLVPFLDSIHVCIDTPPLALGAFVGLAGGSFYVLYDGSTWTPVPTAQFDPGLVLPPPTTAQQVGIQYHYTNAAGCISINDTVATVHPLPQLAVLAPEVCLYTLLAITNNSSITSGTVTEWTWLITGQGTFDMEQIPGLAYPGADTVGIQLNAISDRGCEAMLDVQTIVHPVPVAAFTVSDACQYDTVPYTDLSTIEWNSGVDVIDQWDWRFGDSLGTTGPNPTSHVWNNWGNTFTDTLIVTSIFGCRDTITRTITIHPAPENSIMFSPNCFGQCSPVQSTSTIPQGAIVTTEWMLEGIPYSGLSATHCFSTPDFHPITLLTESDQGCQTLATDTIEVWPLPIPAFTPSVNELCVNDTLIIDDISAIAPSPPYSLAQRQWWVEGQPYDTTTVISVIFPEAGSYAVGLVVTSATGCVDSLFTDGFITVHPLPIAGFTAMPMRTGILQPDILFSDTSYLSVVWRYDLGDGSIAFDQNPSHTYATFGEFLIQQIVETEFGCLDTAWQTVIIDPDLLIYVPNTFTPDGDGINDVFMPSLDGFSLRNYEFTIWNRWGEQIFWTKDRQAGWDGTVNGIMSQDGVYVWQIELRSNEFVAGQRLRGHVILLR